MTTVQKFKTSILFVVLCMVICDMTESTLPEFDCDTNGNIILRNNADLKKIEIVKADNNLCKPGTNNLTGSCGQVANSPITIAYGDHVQIGNDMMGGEDSKYTKLSCNDKKTLVFATMKNVMGAPTKIPVHKIDMKYVTKLSIGGLSNSKAAKLGESFTLFLEGPDNTHSLHPHECKAFATGTTGHKHTIWERHSNTSGYCHNVIPSVIMQNWTTVLQSTGSSAGTGTHNTKLSIGMYAFRFDTSSMVTIECSAYVCPPGEHKDVCEKKCIGGAANRRRRAIHGIQTSPKLNTTRTKIMVASTSFQVQLGDQNTGNSGERLSKNVQLYSVASIFVLMVTMMIR